MLLPSFEIVSVPARANHWLAVKADYNARNGGDRTVESLTWDAARASLGRSDAQASLPGFARDRAERLRALLTDGDDAVERLCRRVASEHERLMCELDDGGLTDERARRAAFAERVAQSPLAPMLFAAASGSLSPEAVRRRLRTPRDACEFADKYIPYPG